MTFKFATSKRDDLVQDYLQRASIRRDVVIEPLMELGCHADVVKESRTIVDFATLALLVHERVDLPGNSIAEDTPPRYGDGASPTMAPIMRVLQKDHDLSSLAVGTVVPSEYYTESDAKAAVRYADHMLSMITDRLSPTMGMERRARMSATMDLDSLTPAPGLARR